MSQPDDDVMVYMTREEYEDAVQRAPRSA